MTTTTSKYSTMERAYLSTLRERFGGTDAQLFELGRTACQMIRAYGSVYAALQKIAFDPDWSLEEARNAGFLFGAAIPLFCPEFFAEAERISR